VLYFGHEICLARDNDSFLCNQAVLAEMASCITC
jgi:hypothetical protein